MYEKLLKLLNNSYSPYSSFRVSAIVVMKDGREFTGVNVENASFGASICAERTAIVSAIASGYQKHDFDKLYVMCDSEKISSCCMLCRQVILEFFEHNCEIINYNNLGEYQTHTVFELCPYPFEEGDLR